MNQLRYWELGDDKSEISLVTLTSAVLQIVEAATRRCAHGASELLEQVAEFWREERRHVDLRNCPPFRAGPVKIVCGSANVQITVYVSLSHLSLNVSSRQGRRRTDGRANVWLMTSQGHKYTHPLETQKYTSSISL